MKEVYKRLTIAPSFEFRIPQSSCTLKPKDFSSIIYLNDMISSRVLLAVVPLSWSGMVYAQDVYDTFTVNCSPLTIQRRDPIVSPNQDLSDHVHSVIGGTAFDAGLTPDRALQSVATTCDKELDHSDYWVPQMYHITPDNKYELVKFTLAVST